MDRYASPEPRRGVRKAEPSSAPLRVDIFNESRDTGIQGFAVSASTRLGDIQKQLCSVFQKPFPKMAVSLNAHGRCFEDFDSRPFEEASAGAVYTAVFEITTQMQHLDQQRKAQMISLCLPNGSLFRLGVHFPTTYEQLMEQVAPHFPYSPSSKLTLSRQDGTTPADYDLVDDAEVLNVSF